MIRRDRHIRILKQIEENYMILDRGFSPFLDPEELCRIYRKYGTKFRRNIKENVYLPYKEFLCKVEDRGMVVPWMPRSLYEDYYNFPRIEPPLPTTEPPPTEKGIVRYILGGLSLIFLIPLAVILKYMNGN